MDKTVEKIGSSERSGERAVSIGRNFSFFSRPNPEEKNQLAEYKDVLDARGDSIGTLIGRATTINGKVFSGEDLLHFSFEIRTGREMEGQKLQDLEGTPLAQPAIFVELPNGKIFGSIGSPDESESKRTIRFDQWVEVEGKKDFKKSELQNHFRNHKAQPRTSTLPELMAARYKII